MPTVLANGSVLPKPSIKVKCCVFSILFNKFAFCFLIRSTTLYLNIKTGLFVCPPSTRHLQSDEVVPSNCSPTDGHHSHCPGLVFCSPSTRANYIHIHITGVVPSTSEASPTSPDLPCGGICNHPRDICLPLASHPS